MIEEPYYHQILHILKKDARHYWYEIAVSLLLLGIFTWREPHEWTETPFTFSFTSVLLGWVPGLLVLSWIYLIVRVIHGETLVGDRQFWVTRPYEWEKLLAAKVLFVAVFVNSPLFIAQTILLKEAGFGVMRHLPGILAMHGFLALMLLLPAALATVTRGLGQVILVGIAALIALIGAGVLISFIPNAEMSSVNSAGEALQGILTFLAAGLAISWQYARRKTWQSRFLLAGAALLILLLQVVTPYERLIYKKYPLAGATRPATVQLAFDLTNVAAKKNPPQDLQSDIMIRIPLRALGMPADEIVVVDGERVAAEAPGLAHWDPGWKTNGAQIWPQQESTWADFPVKKEFYEKIKAVPVTLHISLAMTEYREKNVQEVTAQQREFAVPGIGRCDIEHSDRGYAALKCRAPLREASFIVRATAFSSGCPGEPTDALPDAAKAVQAFEWHGNGNSVDFGISPIKVFGLYFWDLSRLRSLSQSDAKMRLCPGTAIRLATPEQSSHSRVELEAAGIKLEDYRWEQER